MALPVVNPLPPAPVRNDPNFADVAEIWVQYLADTYTPELNALAAAIVLQNSAANFNGTSTTPLTVGTGSKSLTVETGKLYLAGQYVVIASAANPTTRRMYGVVDSYNALNGALVVIVESVVGAATSASDWNVTPSGPIGPASGTVLTNPSVTGSLIEDVYTITDGASVDIDYTNGSIQMWTLGANRTPTATVFPEGVSITLHIADGTNYAVNWTTIGVVWIGGVAPVLPTTGYGIIVLYKAGGVIRGLYCGASAS